MISDRKYYVSSFFWGVLAKLITAVVNFISVPLLLEMYGNSDYGILALAQAANAYISILDLGMNTGAVKYFSQWRAEGKNDLVTETARSNITFYIGIGLINSLVLVFLAVFGNHIFNVTHEQFLILRKCFLILSCFSVFSWVSAAFNQLLVSAEHVSFINKMQCITAFLNVLALIVAVRFRLGITQYFFFVVFISSLLLIPYLVRTVRLQLVVSVLPGWHWKTFKVVFLYSLNIFALSVFQITASNSRPIILGIFSSNATRVSSDYKILSAFPNFILMVGGIVSTILLPKASKSLAVNDISAKENIAYYGTFVTSVLANALCIPFMFCSREVISAYVGHGYEYLSFSLFVWLASILYQIHSTPCNSLILATGKTFYIVISTAIACVFSVVLNIILCSKMEIMAAVVSYAVYVFLVITAYYAFYYRKILGLSGFRIFCSFLVPSTFGGISIFLASLLPFSSIPFWSEEKRIVFIIKCFIKTGVWGVIYAAFLVAFIFIRRKNKVKYAKK